METKQFLNTKPLKLHFYNEEIELARQALKKCGESYILDITELPGIPEHNEQKFEIVCPTSNFQQAYYHIGVQIDKDVLSKRKENKQAKDFTAIISSCKFGQLSITEANKLINEQL